VIGLADQDADRHLGLVTPAIYRIAHSPSRHRAFHDEATGHNSVMLPSGVAADCKAARGWDPVIGWGSSNAQVLVSLIARQRPPPRRRSLLTRRPANLRSQ
jgi:hypothetical protein